MSTKRRRHHSPLKTPGPDQDADNLNRLEAASLYASGRSITPEEGKAVTNLRPAEQREFTRIMNIADGIKNNP